MINANRNSAVGYRRRGGLGPELVDQDDMSGGNWVAGVSIAITYASSENFIESSGATQFVYNLAPVTAGETYKVSFDAKAITTGGNPTDPMYAIYDHTNSAWIVVQTAFGGSINQLTYTTIDFEFTAPVGCAEIRLYSVRNFDSNDDMYVKNNSCKKVL